MPTTAKSSSNVAKVGDLSTYTIGTTATPYDTADSSGSVPTVSIVAANGVETDYLIDESLTIAGPAVGSYEGKIVDLSNATDSGQYSLGAETILSRLNSDQRVYPQSLFYIESAWLPIAALDYWSQQCGIFYDKVDGDVLFYQSQFVHSMAFAKGTTRPLRGNIYASTGVNPTLISVNGRYALTFGTDGDVKVPFETGRELPVLIPAASDPRKVVFSSNVVNQGTGRKSTITWNLVGPTGATYAIRLIIDSAAGISMERVTGSTTYSLGSVIAGAVNGSYRVDLGVSSASSTTTQFTLQVLDSSGALVGSTSGTPSTSLSGNLSLTGIYYRGENQGSGSQQAHWGDSISVMDAMPVSIPAVQKSFTPGPKKDLMFSGFSGNVWEKVKEYCSIFHLDISCPNGVLTVGPRTKTTTPATQLGGTRKRTNTRDAARFVEVVNQNSEPTISGNYSAPKVMWKADTVYQVAVGETQEFTVQTDHSILTLSQPVAVSGINPYPYTQGAGQYVVTGSDGYIVSPAFWRDQGGKITVDTTENEGEIKVTIKGPDFQSSRAPYRISEGDAGRPALYITGSGIINKPTTLKVSTGNTKAAKEVGTKIESPFISSAVLAYDAAARAARRFATPDVTVSVAEFLDYDKPSNLGVIPAGKLVRSDGNILRITDASQTHSQMTGTAVQHNTIGLVKESFGSGTIGDMKTYYGGKTIKQTNLKPLKVGK